MHSFFLAAQGLLYCTMFFHIYAFNPRVMYTSSASPSIQRSVQPSPRDSACRLPLSLLMSRIRFAHNVQVSVVSLPTFPSNDLLFLSASIPLRALPNSPLFHPKPNCRRSQAKQSRHTLQCSHLFFTALPTFIPRLCCATGPATALFFPVATAVLRHTGRERIVEKARGADAAVVRIARSAGRERRRDAIVAGCSWGVVMRLKICWGWRLKVDARCHVRATTSVVGT